MLQSRQEVQPGFPESAHVLLSPVKQWNALVQFQRETELTFTLLFKPLSHRHIARVLV